MSRKRFKRRGDTASFVMFQHRMLRDRRFISLSGRACHALLYLAGQFNGKNNGDLGIAWTVARAKGVTSNSNLRAGVNELLDRGFIVLTRQGGRNKCSLYALGWFPIDECGGKLDIPATRVAPNDWLWKNETSKPPAVQHEPSTVQLEKKPPDESED